MHCLHEEFQATTVSVALPKQDPKDLGFLPQWWPKYGCQGWELGCIFYQWPDLQMTFLASSDMTINKAAVEFPYNFIGTQLWKELFTTKMNKLII